MTSRKGKKAAQPRKGRYWSADVMWRSNALDLEEGVFRFNSPRKIAESLR